MLDQDFSHLCRGRGIHTSGHSDFGILSNFGSIFHLDLKRTETASAACPLPPGNLAMTSMIFAAVNCDAEEPCSVKTAYTVSSEHDSAFILLQFLFLRCTFEVAYVHQ